jgi:hypothetical protein
MILKDAGESEARSNVGAYSKLMTSPIAAPSTPARRMFLPWSFTTAPLAANDGRDAAISNAVLKFAVPMGTGADLAFHSKVVGQDFVFHGIYINAVDCLQVAKHRVIRDQMGRLGHPAVSPFRT